MTTCRKTKALRSAPVRCAIYTRKSTEEGLDQDFNSLDAQREAAEAYIHSQAHAGWTALPTRYDDGGYSGSNLDRPALQRLLADIQAGHINCVLTHRVDRLSRSLLDFAKLMELFEQHQVAFVSVTQHFNSATSMGRLVLTRVVVLFPVRARADCRANAGQGGGSPAQGEMVRRPAGLGL
jgi:site-specific DNA recombinase